MMRAFLDSLEQMSREQLMLALARRELRDSGPVTIVGLGCHLPGGVDTPAAFHDGLLAGRVVTPGDEPPAQPDYLRPWTERIGQCLRLGAGIGSYVDGLVTVLADAVRDAEGVRPADRRTSLYLAASTTELALAQAGPDTGPAELIERAAPEANLSAIPALVARRLGLLGAGLMIDTACSSGLVALHLATGALRRHECDIALIGAAHLLFSPMSTVALDQSGLLSPSGRSQPFTERADGFVRADGLAAVVLMRTEDVRREQLRGYATVRGTAATDAGHAEAAGAALADARAEAADVRFVEVHANGGAFAETVELEGLGRVYRDAAVTSYKANFGYPETAAGLVGLVRAACAVHRGEWAGQPDVGPPASDRLRLPVLGRTTGCSPDTLVAVNAVGITGVHGHAVLQSWRAK